MVNTKNTQEWFNEKYKNKKDEKDFHLLTIDNRDLEDELLIEGFSNLETIECFGNKLTTLSIRNCPNLTKLLCYQNELTKLEIEGCLNISHLNVSCNLLKNLIFLNNLGSEELVYLSVHTNDLRNDDGKTSNLSLEVFGKFTNLEELYIDNYEEEKFKSNVYNRFTGSLKSLENLKNLRLLNISGTDIDSGLEYLPESVKKVECRSAEWKDLHGIIKKWSCSKIEEELKEASKTKDVTEELKEFEEEDTKWTAEWYRIAPWREVQEINLEKIKHAQEWLNKEYPKKRVKKNRKDLWINAQNLRGSLDLSEFVNLERLYCYNNRLTELKLNNLENLTEIHAWNNKLSNLDITGCSKIKKLNISNNRLVKIEFIENLLDLEFLNITDNDFCEKTENEKNFLNLSFFSSLENLKELYVGNWHNLGKEKFNRFTGSLEPLKFLKKLEYLGIDNTNISNGLEHLSENLEEIHCSTEREGSKCREIRQELKKHTIPGRKNSYDFQAWMRNSEKGKNSILERFFGHQIRLVKELEKTEEIDKKITEEKQLGSRSKWFGYAGGGLSTIGSGVSGVLANTNFASGGSILNIVIPTISSMGGVSSAYGTYLANNYAEKEKVYKEELNNALAKLGIDMWNKFLRDKEELEEKKPLVKRSIDSLFESDKTMGEKVKELFENFLKVGERLPKSINPEEKQRMKKELQEQFTQNLWENYWIKNDYELKNKLENLLNKLSVKLAKPEEALRTKLNDILEELENIKKGHQKGKERRENVWRTREHSVNKAISSVKEILRYLQEEKEGSVENDEKIKEIMKEKVESIDNEVKSIISEAKEEGIEIEQLGIKNTIINVNDKEEQEESDKIVALQEVPGGGSTKIK